MENASDAQKVVAAANKKEMIIAGKHPKIKVSMKHSHLNKRYLEIIVCTFIFKETAFSKHWRHLEEGAAF